MEQKDEGYFAYYAKIDKVYRKLCALEVAEYCFTPNEIVVLMFLANNPGYDSASDIAHFRNISKGLVAKSVETLCERGYLKAGKDLKDRRLIHLSLTEKSDDIVTRLRKCRQEFAGKLYDGVPREDMEAMARTTKVINQNLDDILKGMKSMEPKKGKENELGTESVGKLLFRLSMPAIAAQVINVMYNMVDRMYIGHIPGVGAAALTGVGVTMPVIMAITAFAYFISMGGAPRSSIMMGRNEKEKAEKILGNCTTMLVVLALILTAVFLFCGRSILLLFGASENTIGYAWDYMKIYALGTIFVQLALGLNAFITAQGYAKTSMYTVLIGAVCNIILDPIFIFGLNMGVKGAALATILSQAVSSIWVLRFLTSEKSSLRIKKKSLKLEAGIILPCMALGTSPFIMAFTESILSVCFNSSLLRYGGDVAVGAMTILSSVMQFSMLPLQGLTQGSQPIVSFNYGDRKSVV